MFHFSLKTIVLCLFVTTLSFGQDPVMIRGFVIDDFTQAAPMLQPVGRGQITLKDKTIELDEETNGILWNDSKINITPGFTMSLEFSAKPSKEMRDMSAFFLNNDAGGAFEVFSIMQKTATDVAPDVILGRDMRRPAKSPVNVFDGQKHSVEIQYTFTRFDPKQKIYLYKGSIRIDGKLLAYSPEVFLDISEFALFEVKTNQWFGFPQVFLKDGTIYSWSVKVNKPGPVLQNADFEKYSSYFIVDGKKYLGQNILRELKTDQRAPVFAVIQLFERNLKGQPYVHFLNYYSDDQLDMVNGNYKLPDEKLALVLNDYGPDFLEYKTPMTGAKGTIVITEATRYDGTKGKLVTIENVEVSRQNMSPGKKSVSGKLYVWEKQPLGSEK